MQFRVTDPAVAGMQQRATRSKHYDLVTALLDTYDHNPKQVVEVTLDPDNGENSTNALSGAENHLLTRTRHGSRGAAHLHRRLVGPYRYQIWISYPYEEERRGADQT